MKKSLLLSILLLIASLLFASCGKTASYVAMNLVWQEDEYIEHLHLPSKTETVFGKSYEMTYDGTWHYPARGYSIDRYTSLSQNSTTQIYFEKESQNVMYYHTLSLSYQTDKAPITPDAGEKGFLAYVKALIKNTAGVSTDGWSYRTETYHPAHGYSKGFVVGDTTTEYIFTFYKTIDGIERCDRMEVRLTAYGEIITFNAMHRETVFSPFESQKLDSDAIREIAEEAFGNRFPDARSFTVTQTELVAQHKVLYAHVYFDYTDELGSDQETLITVKLITIEE